MPGWLMNQGDPCLVGAVRSCPGRGIGKYPTFGCELSCMEMKHSPHMRFTGDVDPAIIVSQAAYANKWN